ncbi:MAG: FAD-dependent oxidoreductase [Gammaproteobacteria bacterium]|nr:FAD-dependent oxidoreductase [Gammaproteobacteria bacterium]
MRTVKADIAIAGAGIAGLWLANLLVNRGFDVAVCESGKVGGIQTMASQGLIHGGVKYALGGIATGAFDAVSGMPNRWRACLEGKGEIDLQGVGVTSDCYYLWSHDELRARLAGFLASRLLRGRVARLAPTEYPGTFAGQTGTMYRLDDFVIDVAGLVRRLAAPLTDRILPVAVEPEGFVMEQGTVAAFENANIRVEAQRFIFAAGAGNEPLAAAAGAPTRMQRRPLKQVLIRSTDPEPIFAHCISDLRTEPALTVTTLPGYHYLGGALASDGANRSDAEQVEAARMELQRSLPWIDWSNRTFETLSIDRAEPDGPRLEGAFVESHENVLVTWPGKLTLAPDLGDRVLRALA